MRASGASELRKFWYFYILKLLFLSLFCWYIRYFVGTNDMLVGLHVPTKCIYSITNTNIKEMYVWYMRASGASELNFFLVLLHSKSAISFIILLVHQILCRYKMTCLSAYNVPTIYI